MTRETMSKVSVLIVDDEEPARGLLREMLAGHADLRILGEAADGVAAVKLATELCPEILLLDVHMPRLDGFEVLELIAPEIAVIFTTAYDEYAVRAFEVNAVDYLLKPFSRERFDEALSRARARVGHPRAVAASDLAAAGRPVGSFLERIVVRDGARIEIIPTTSLDYAEGQGDYIELHTGARSCLKQQTLQSLEQSLDPARFVRIHRSFLLNVERLKRIEPMGRDSKVAVLTGGQQLPISRAGEARLKELLEQRG